MARYRFAVTLLSYLVVGLLLSACAPATSTSSSATLVSAPAIFPTQEETPAPDFTRYVPIASGVVLISLGMIMLSGFEQVVENFVFHIMGFQGL